MRYVAIAALAATFWLLVATVRLMLHADCRCARPFPVAPAAPPVPTPPFPTPPRIEPLAAAARCPDPVPLAERIRRAERQDSDSPAAITRGFLDVRPDLCACWDRPGRRGRAGVKLRIAPNGRVSSVSVTGQFVGTPMGACVARVAKTAVFPRSPVLRGAEFPFVVQ